MLTSPIEILSKVEDRLEHLLQNYTLIMITKGDLNDSLVFTNIDNKPYSKRWHHTKR